METEECTTTTKPIDSNLILFNYTHVDTHGELVLVERRR